jgi:phosphatidylserine/phosphatidylglycerophosphate/cardiolipin synthase-like enzyme
MKLKDTLDILVYAQQYGVDIASLNSFILYLDDSNGYISANRISDEFNISHGVSSEMLQKLKKLGVVGEKGGRYNIIREEFLNFYRKVEWLATEENNDFIEQLFNGENDPVDFLFTFPKAEEEASESTITGEMINLVASAQERVLVVNPFFDYSGIDVFLNALVSATENSQLTILTRDIFSGDESNQEALKMIAEAIEESGDINNFELKEFNKDQFPQGSIHAKMIVSDEEKAFLGSANITETSQQRAFEAGVLISGEKVSSLESDIDDFLKSRFVKTVSTDKLLDQ